MSAPYIAQMAGTTPTPTPTPDALLLAKTDYALREQRELQTAQASTPIPKRTATLAPTTWPPPTPNWIRATTLAGGGKIIQIPGNVLGQDRVANNFWAYIVSDDSFVLVHAVNGSDQDTQQGGVIVELYQTSTGNLQSQNYYSTPNTSGGARITDAVVSAGVQRVLVHTDSGSTFIFNVTTRQWESGTVLPTPAPATNTPTRTPLPGTATPVPSATRTPTPSRTPTRTPSPTATRTPTAIPTQQPSSTPTSIPNSAFPAAAILDTFNRADSQITSGWIGNPQNYRVRSNRLANLGGNVSTLLWNADFGANQEVYATLSAIDASSDEIDLVLKAQDTSECNLLEAWYQPSRGTVKVLTCYNFGTWAQEGVDIPVTFTAGDRFGARAKANGTVDIYKNSTKVGTVTITSGWKYANGGGKVGVWLIDAQNTFLDDIGGGNVP